MLEYDRIDFQRELILVKQINQENVKFAIICIF